MGTDNKIGILSLVKCDQGDGIALKFKKQIISVDWLGVVHKHKATTEQTYDVSCLLDIRDLTNFRLGHTYVIDGSIAKLIESNLFGLRFLIVSPESKIEFKDYEYDEILELCRTRKIYAIK